MVHIHFMWCTYELEQPGTLGQGCYIWSTGETAEFVALQFNFLCTFIWRCWEIMWCIFIRAPWVSMVEVIWDCYEHICMRRLEAKQPFIILLKEWLAEGLKGRPKQIEVVKTWRVMYLVAKTWSCAAVTWCWQLLTPYSTCMGPTFFDPRGSYITGFLMCRKWPCFWGFFFSKNSYPESSWVRMDLKDVNW